MDGSRTIWLPEDSGEKLRLFCFPYAGAGASIFVGWRRFAGEAAICPIQLPGRENRLQETAHDRIEPLVQELADVMTPYLEKSYSFYGHSMGGIIAFELCHEFRRRGLPLPRVLFVGASRAPQFANPNPPISHLPDVEFIEALGRRYGGIPEAVLNQPEIMRLFLPTLRGDFSLLENYKMPGRPPLECAIVCIGGTLDDSIPKLELDGWREHTSGTFELCFVDGDHFFAKTAAELVMDFIDSRVRVSDRGR